MLKVKNQTGKKIRMSKLKQKSKLIKKIVASKKMKLERECAFIEMQFNAK